MEEREKEQVRALDPRNQRRVLIVAYWRRVEEDELHVGYGVAKGYV